LPDIAKPSRDSQVNQQKTVLVVDDEIQARHAGASYLRDAGFRVIEATDGQEAMAIFASKIQVDLVFSDIKMPGPIDGVALAHWIRDHHPETPVLLTSGVLDIRATAMETWGKNFIAKPFIFATVEKRILELLAGED
jgi:DNA-binding NtrC family response regulator